MWLHRNSDQGGGPDGPADHPHAGFCCSLPAQRLLKHVHYAVAALALSSTVHSVQSRSKHGFPYGYRAGYDPRAAIPKDLSLEVEAALADPAALEAADPGPPAMSRWASGRKLTEIYKATNSWKAAHYAKALQEASKAYGPQGAAAAPASGESSSA